MDKYVNMKWWKKYIINSIDHTVDIIEVSQWKVNF